MTLWQYLTVNNIQLETEHKAKLYDFYESDLYKMICYKSTVCSPMQKSYSSSDELLRILKENNKVLYNSIKNDYPEFLI